MADFTNLGRALEPLAAQALADEPSLEAVEDHGDGNGLNNRIDNLSSGSCSDNQKNSRLKSNNTSGVPGVLWRKNRWLVTISSNGKRMHLGSFVDFDEAVSVRRTAENKFGFHKNHGRR